MEIGEAVGVSGGACSSECPFCSEKKWYGYKTKHGALKKEKVLAANLRARGDVTSDETVGNVYPLAGGGDRTTGWEAAPGVLEDFKVGLAAAPHHLIPGNASMQPSRVEKWTCASKGMIKEDVGYNIDCAQNGIFLPHLPAIYWTRHAPGTKVPMAQYYGKKWRDLSPTAKQSIGALVMGETCLQMHYTDHDDPYVHVDNDATYDDECKQECNHLADLMQLLESKARCKDDDGKLAPPYSIVHRLNLKSLAVKHRITGFPVRWTSWVSPLAQEYTHDLTLDPSAPLARFKGRITRVTD